MNQTQRAQTNASDDNTSVATSPRLLLQRLKIEALLKRLGAEMHVHQDRILMKSVNHVAVITVSESAEEATRVEIEALTGEDLLHENLADIVRARNEQIKPIQIEFADNRVTRLVWRAEFPNEIETKQVVEALKAVAAEIDSLRIAVTEDFLLATPERSSVSESTTGEAA